MTYQLRMELGPRPLVYVDDPPGDGYYDGPFVRDVIEVTQGDTPDPDAVLVLDDLRVGWRWSGEVLPAQLDVIEATVRLATRDVAQLAQLRQGDITLLELRTVLDGSGPSAWPVVASCYGHLAELTADQTLRARPGVDGGVDVWTVYTLRIVDGSVALNVPVNVTRPAENPGDRAFYLSEGLNAAGVPADLAYDDSGVDQDRVTATLEPLAVEETGAVDLVRTLAGESFIYQLDYRDGEPEPIEGWPVSGRAPVVAFPRAIPSGYSFGPVPTFQIGLQRIDPFVDSVDLPFYLADVDGVVGLVPHADAPKVIPADQVELAGSWRQGTASDVNAVTVRNDDVAVTVYRDDYVTGDQLNRREVASGYETKAAMRELGRLYLPDSGVGAWGRESFTWHVPDPTILHRPGTWGRPQWFPHFNVDTVSSFDCLGPAPVAIHGVPDQANLTGSRAGVVAGRLLGVDLQLVRGQVFLTFALSGHYARPKAAGVSADLTFQRLRNRFLTNDTRLRPTSPSARRVDPGITLQETRLIRNL